MRKRSAEKRLDQPSSPRVADLSAVLSARGQRGRMSRALRTGGQRIIDALRMAWFKCHPSKQAGLIFNSDRGNQPGLKGRVEAIRLDGLDEPVRQLLEKRLQPDAVRAVRRWCNCTAHAS